jgi:FKBP-type peptidyl-prolyl cis-trans isomerase 2
MEEEKKTEGVKSAISDSQPAVQPIENSPGKRSTFSRLNWKKIIIALVALILIVLIVLVLTDVIKLGKSTGSTKETLNITYNVYSNGVLLESSSDVYEKNKISSSFNLKSTVLDEAINNMVQGQEKNITIQPKDAYGEYDPSLVFSYPRVERQPRTNDIDRIIYLTPSDFSSRFSEQPILNKVYNLSGAPWQYKVVSMNSTDVGISQEAVVNQEIPLGMFYYKVLAVTSNKITLRIFGNNTIVPSGTISYMINFTDSEIITTLVPEIGQVMQLTDYPSARVVSMNSTDILLDGNDVNAGKTIVFDVKLVERKIEKGSTIGSSIKHIDGAPTLQFFIMSHCPYGTQMAKGVIPVWEKFQNKANIELRFVSYTMHGNKEVLDNNRLLCIREEQSSKLINYLKCFVYGDGSEASSQSCIKSSGIDVASLDSCIASRVEGYMEADKALNTQYGVQGSPTVIIDGEEASVYPRDPASVAKALCSAFKTKPPECSLSFDSTNPSPGFGGGTASSSGSAASCG